MVYRPILACLAVLGAAGLCACDRKDSNKNEDPPVTAQVKTITLSSDAFKEGGEIPKKYTGEGQDISPPLQWSGVPAEARELVLIADDPDAPGDVPFVHWVLYNFPGTVNSLAEGVERTREPASPEHARQGKNSAGTLGYFGPMPPPGRVHHYHFRLYAVDKALNLKPELKRDQVMAAMNKADVHILAEGELIGTYQRK